MPFVVVPPLAIYSARALQCLNRIDFSFLEFRRLDYMLITCVAYAYCYYQFRRSNVDEILARHSPDLFGSVAARFEILEALGFWSLVIMKSVLVFLAVYSLVRAMRSREWFWIVMFLINLMALSQMLVWLNMKWPVLIYYVAIVLCIFLFSKRHPYLNAALATAGVAVIYLVISVTVLRLAEFTITENTTVRYSPTEGEAQPKPRIAQKRPAPPSMIEVARNSVSFAPLLVTTLLNRMALPYPYYYQIFTERGQICGTLVDRILRKTNPCHPSNLIYEEMHVKDAFGGKATAPAAVHVTGYALQGWTGALIEIVLASIVIGSFMALWKSVAASALAATIFVMGGYSAYFFSQLPFEGPIVYDHGILWWTILLLVYAGYRLLLAPGWRKNFLLRSQDGGAPVSLLDANRRD